MESKKIVIQNSNGLVIKLSDILKLIPDNNLKWYILELSGSGKINFINEVDSMQDLMYQIEKKKFGIQVTFEELRKLSKSLHNLDECFIVGTAKDNNESISEISKKKKKYKYIIDYFDSSTLEINSSDINFIKSISSFYNMDE